MGEIEDLARRRIAKWRHQYGISQERLGEVAEPPMHQTTVGAWLNGEATVTVDTLQKWARLFGRTLFDLVAHDDVGKPADVVAAFNALPTDDLREKMLATMLAMGAATTRVPPPAPTRAAKRAAKRGE
jgi:transcriptional regulator with XRE-family HTH domain